jgi:antitoxin (DNA-binding transcriptional repressor) of toxin-antitoxin stability system
MDVVTISELKNNLSRYLKRVRRGGVVLVRDRDEVIARIEAAGGSSAGDDASWLDALERRGTIRRGRGTVRPDWRAARPRVGVDVVAALLAERDEGR